jgi:hypothetical protein
MTAANQVHTVWPDPHGDFGPRHPRRPLRPLPLTSRGPATRRPGHFYHSEDTMPVNAQPRRTRPNSTPAYYLGRPASLWITATTRRRGAPGVRCQATWASIARQAT